jgi:hypothetical protein
MLPHAQEYAKSGRPLGDIPSHPKLYIDGEGRFD